jgi:DNA-binding TFAR19-related protein (PDSD5 family)
VVEHLPGKCETLSSNSYSAKKREEEEKEEGEEEEEKLKRIIRKTLDSGWRECLTVMKREGAEFNFQQVQF